MAFNRKILIALAGAILLLAGALRQIPVASTAETAKVNGVPPTAARPLLFDFQLDRYLLPRELVWGGWPWTPYFRFYSDPHVRTGTASTSLSGWRIQLIAINPNFSEKYQRFFVLATLNEMEFIVPHNNPSLRDVLSATLLPVDSRADWVLFVRPDEGYADPGVDLFLLDVSGEEIILSGGLLSELHTGNPALEKLESVSMGDEIIRVICEDDNAVQSLSLLPRAIDLDCN